MSTETATAPDWIYPGAEVIAYRDMPGKTDTSYKRTTVARMAGQSFTLADVDERIKLDGLVSKRLGGSWNSYQYRVTPVGSDEHLTMQAARRKAKAESDAHRAVDEWLRKRKDVVTTDAVIAALIAHREEMSR